MNDRTMLRKGNPKYVTSIVVTLWVVRRMLTAKTERMRGFWHRRLQFVQSLRITSDLHLKPTISQRAWAPIIRFAFTAEWIIRDVFCSCSWADKEV